MKRWTILFAICTVALAADAPQQVFDLFSKIASALADNDATAFVDAVDPNMPHFYDFRAGLAALVATADLTSSVEVISDAGDDTHREAELDWILQIVGRSDPHSVEDRHQTVKFRLERKGKKWKITSIEPLNFFGPPKGG
ncbi:MAG TPA: hypothetical protein VMI94_27295 [Bryobacteraceae bacterium]|nr:hypothetical protein [Bryobacteraceae bacterium]